MDNPMERNAVAACCLAVILFVVLLLANVLSVKPRDESSVEVEKSRENVTEPVSRPDAPIVPPRWFPWDKPDEKCKGGKCEIDLGEPE